eukprot:CAMPEP_0194397478 /NCGR_PEP_ID=MMETSP0174-20130528/125565_1 /TAXON_ID=216777 /ORGANISM="Proboscia alata, Strain PI-D3" /LENGTH=136 /DNA_ID=CAMNT_0039193657 /DNA_START=638 /DNA_END=1045 /DNA_ORIENTATION=-
MRWQQRIRNDMLAEVRVRSKTDSHMFVHNPLWFIHSIANAGATQFVFQWEAIPNQNNPSTVPTPTSTCTSTDNIPQNLPKLTPHLAHIAQEVLNAGINCRILLNPSTPLETIYLLLQTGLIDMVYLLAVEPGFGGQ